MKRAIVALLLVFAAAGVYADATYEIRGSLREWVKVFACEPNPVSMAETRLELNLLSSFSLGDTEAAFNTQTYFVYDPKNLNELNIDMQEAYIDLYGDLIDFRIGKQVISWGKADEINPTDVINPERLYNITEEKNIRKIGLMAVKADLKAGGFVLSSICVPDFAMHELPAPGSAWDFYAAAMAEQGLTELTILQENRPDAAQWAFKLSKTIGMLDFSVSYANVWDNLYSVKVKMVPPGIPEPEALVFYRTQMAAADMAASLFDFGIWAEGAYFITQDRDGTDPFIKNPYIQYVAGADYTFPNDIKVNVQFFHEIITCVNDEAERETEEAAISRLGLSIPVQQAMTFRLAKNFGEADADSVEVFGIWDIKEGGILAGPRIIISPADAVKVELGASIFDGTEGSIFSLFNKNDELYVKAAYSF